MTPVPAIFGLNTIDVVFLLGILIVGAVLTALMNPLTSWVSKLIKRKDD